MKLISKKELRELLIDSERLARLEAFGVDNWEGYDYALSENRDFGKDFLDWEEVDVDDLLNEYPDYNINSFDDNYNFE